METPKLSKLIPVPVKEIWPLEASAFTPWLLANAEVLGEALGIDLELEGKEHKVGGFSLDLLGRDTGSDEIVIIENQFGPTDHRHLGQVLTYAGGTDPTSIVWIAEIFRDEHRAALDWLNQRTDSETRFFGVELRTVTLDGAPVGLVAPLLDVVAKPNDWGKAVRKAATGARSQREELYLEFWTTWLERVAGYGWTDRKAPAKHWLYLPSGATGSRFAVSFRSDGLLSELFLNSADRSVNLARWELLEKKRSVIEEAFGGPLAFEDLPNRKGCRVGVRRVGDESIEKREAWEDYFSWFESTQAKLRAAIDAAGGIPPLPGLDDEDIIEN